MTEGVPSGEQPPQLHGRALDEHLSVGQFVIAPHEGNEYVCRDRQELAGMLAGPFFGRDDYIVRWKRDQGPTVWTDSPVRSDWGVKAAEG